MMDFALKMVDRSARREAGREEQVLQGTLVPDSRHENVLLQVTGRAGLEASRHHCLSKEIRQFQFELHHSGSILD